MHPPETPPLTHRGGLGRQGLAAWMALPPEPGPDPTPLIAVHGIRRQAQAQAKAFAARAAALGRPVIAPEFDEARWPVYQQAVRRGRADLALLDLLEELRLAGIWRTPRVELFGYSGGAQFVHRFAMLYPHLVGRLSLAAAGWYTMPDAAPFPYGLGPREGRGTAWGALMGARLGEFLGLPVTVAVGAQCRAAAPGGVGAGAGPRRTDCRRRSIFLRDLPPSTLDWRRGTGKPTW